MSHHLDLHRIIRSDGPMNVRGATDCILQAGRGLLAAQEFGIVHLDIKPANLLVDAGGLSASSTWDWRGSPRPTTPLRALMTIPA